MTFWGAEIHDAQSRALFSALCSALYKDVLWVKEKGEDRIGVDVHLTDFPEAFVSFVRSMSGKSAFEHLLIILMVGRRESAQKLIFFFCLLGL